MEDLKIDIKTYWKIFWLTLLLCIPMFILAFYEITWAMIPLALIILFLFGLMKVCTITKKNDVSKQKEVTVENRDKFKPFESLQREYLKDNIKRAASFGENE